jgi:hypothetical protein
VADRGICVVEGCTRKVNARGHCQTHSQQFRAAGVTIPGAKWTKCSVDGCERYVFCRGWCKKHYSAWERHGDPLVRKKAERGTGYVTSNGYRMIGRKFEHRIVMEGVLGRRLEAHETVHHRNGDKLDNRPENLELHVGRHGRGATEAHCSTCCCFGD